MKIPTRSSKKIVLVTLASVVVVGYGAAAYALSLWPFTASSDTSTTQNAVTDTPQEQKEDPVSEKPDPKEPKENPYEEEPNQTAPDSSLTITKLSQGSGKVNVGATVNNVSKNGRCIVYFTANVEGYSVSEYMNLANTTDGVTCSVAIDELKFTYLGKWSARVVYTTPENKKVEAAKTVTIQ